MTAPIIRMDRVTRRFGKVLAVSDMSLTINEGEFVSFLGPSGCGKSTALKMIAGLLPVSAGTITITPPKGKSEQDLGFVFQEPTLMPWATVFDAPGFGMTTLVEMFVFLGFITAGLVYAWRKGVLTWT